MNHQLAATAHHEAGHAVVASSLGYPVMEVTVDVESGERGAVPWGSPVFGPNPEDVRAQRHAAEARVTALLAGEIAERNYFVDAGVEFDGVELMICANQDHTAARALCEALAGGDWEALYNHLDSEAEHILARQSAAIRAIAQALLERGRLGGEEVTAIILAAREK